MGLCYAEMKIARPDGKVEPVHVTAMADTGSVHMIITPEIADHLELEELEKRSVTLADGNKKEVSYVGPIQVSFEDRSCFTGALVMGNEPLLGAIPMEDMDLVVQPLAQKVSKNPLSPTIASAKAK